MATAVRSPFLIRFAGTERPTFDFAPQTAARIPLVHRYAVHLVGICDIHVVLMAAARSEEHTSELQSQSNLVCRLLLEKKKELKKPDEVANTAIFECCTCDNTT